MFRWIEVTVAALMIGFFAGYYEGRISTRAERIMVQKAQMAAADLASTKEAERLAAEAKTANLAQQLEDAANAQVSSAVCLPIERVVRLNQR